MTNVNITWAWHAQRNQVRIRNDGLLIKGNYSLAVQLCHEFSFRYFSLSEQRFFFFGGGEGGGGEERINSTVDYCVLSFLGIRIRFYSFFLLFSYTSPTELTQSLCKVKQESFPEPTSWANVQYFASCFSCKFCSIFLICYC